MSQKVALVLEGGGKRGAFTAGVLCWLIENNIQFDFTIGISIGSLYGVFYILKEKDLLKKVSIEIAPNKEYIGIKSIAKEGQIISYNQMFDVDLPNVGFDVNKLNETNEKVYVGVYSLEDSETQFKTNPDIVKYPGFIKAASTLPIFGKQVKCGGKNYLDGGITTMIPIFHAKDLGATKFLIVTTKSPDYVRKPFPKWQLWILKNFVYRNNKKMITDFASRTPVYYKERAEVEKEIKENNAINLFPSQGFGVSRYKGTKEQFEKLFNDGIAQCEKHREQILNLFK